MVSFNLIVVAEPLRFRGWIPTLVWVVVELLYHSYQDSIQLLRLQSSKRLGLHPVLWINLLELVKFTLQSGIRAQSSEFLTVSLFSG